MEKTVEEENIYLEAILYFVESTGLNPRFPRFLSVLDKDPSDWLLQECRNKGIPFKPLSQSIRKDDGIYDPETKSDGVLVFVNSFKWKNQNSAELWIGDYFDSLAIATYGYVFEKVDQNWRITKVMEGMVA